MRPGPLPSDRLPSPASSPLERFLAFLPRQLRRQRLLALLHRSGLVSPVQRIHFNGDATAWVDLRDAESRATLLAGSFWPEFPPMVAAFLRGGGDLFDVGANLGLVTLGVLPLVAGRGTRFHLFEANSRLIPLLERSAGEWTSEDVQIVQACVTDRPGVSHFTLPDSHWGHGRITAEGQAVPNLRLDDYVAEHGIRRIAFLKLDVEGWELRALRGTLRTLRSGIVHAGYVEIAPNELRRAGTRPEEVLELLESCGFDLYFAGAWESTEAHDLRWVRLDVDGTSLRFARANPLPSSFVQGDVLVLHRSTPLASRVRAAFGEGMP